MLHLAPEIQDGIASADNNPNQTEEVVRFKNASFRFADGDENTLENLDLPAKEGKQLPLSAAQAAENLRLQN